jgi:hypothetical protein
MFYWAPCKRQKSEKREISILGERERGRKYSRRTGESEKQWEKWTTLYFGLEGRKELFCSKVPRFRPLALLVRADAR